MATGHRGQSSLVRTSKALSWLLRHGAEKEGIELDEGGYLDLDTLLCLPRFRNLSIRDIELVVNDNDKQRFTLRENPVTGRKQIKANQGHTLKVKDLDLKVLTEKEAKKYENVIHGTYFDAWEKIVSSGGISRMRRNHIHLSPGEAGDEGVVSGMRNSAIVWIYVDIVQAIRDGFEFFLSPNHVILCAGNDQGILPTKYFRKTVHRQRDGNHRILFPTIKPEGKHLQEATCTDDYRREAKSRDIFKCETSANKRK